MSSGRKCTYTLPKAKIVFLRANSGRHVCLYTNIACSCFFLRKVGAPVPESVSGRLGEGVLLRGTTTKIFVRGIVKPIHSIYAKPKQELHSWQIQCIAHPLTIQDYVEDEDRLVCCQASVGEISDIRITFLKNYIRSPGIISAFHKKQM